MKKIVKLCPYYSEKVWGYEKWILSTHKNGYSFLDGENKTLFEYLNEDIPILIKEIKANDTLSVQVHPSDDYARMYEGDNGKTECWYILDCKDGAHLICGIKEGLSKEEFRKIIENGNEIEKYLKRIYVKKGDMIYIEAGTVHAIEGGIRLIEVQQCSDVTYRIYDWGRDREVHINKALDVINFNKNSKSTKIENFKILNTPYFTVEKINVNECYKSRSDKKYDVYICLEGSANVTYNSQKIYFKSGESIYILNGVDYEINGNAELLKVY